MAVFVRSCRNGTRLFQAACSEKLMFSVVLCPWLIAAIADLLVFFTWATWDHCDWSTKKTTKTTNRACQTVLAHWLHEGRHHLAGISADNCPASLFSVGRLKILSSSLAQTPYLPTHASSATALHTLHTANARDNKPTFDRFGNWRSIQGQHTISLMDNIEFLPASVSAKNKGATDNNVILCKL